MDAEDYYEQRRLKTEDQIARFDALVEEKRRIFEKAIRQEFASGFSGNADARLPTVVGLDANHVEYSMTLASAIADVCSHDEVVSLLLAVNSSPTTDLVRRLEKFRQACADAYIAEYADDLAEVAARNEILEGDAP